MLQTKDSKDRPGEGADLISDMWDHLNRDSRASLLQDKEVVHLPPLVGPTLLLQFRRVATAPGSLLTSGERGGKRTPTVYGWHLSITICTTTQEADTLIAPLLRHMERNRCRWHFVKEDDPLKYAVLLNDFFEEVHGYCLLNLDHYTEWIKPRGWCDKVILQREQLNYCKHLMGVEPPPEDVERPSESTLHSHRAAYEAAKQSGPSKLVKKTKATLLETLVLHGRTITL